MIDRIIWNIVISFVLRQIEKFGKLIDWDKVKADVEARVRAVVPGTWFDDEAVAAVMVVLDTVKNVLSATAALEEIMQLLSQEKYTEAAARLKEMLICAWAGGCPSPRAKTLVLAA